MDPTDIQDLIRRFDFVLHNAKHKVKTHLVMVTPEQASFMLKLLEEKFPNLAKKG